MAHRKTMSKGYAKSAKKAPKKMGMAYKKKMMKKK